ncbi:hypothetical protein [Acinetobacter venetianus]|uniref:hypothetical protein n=1 Tax=Acinetobacter venetianus TaxID=52133 RepID=UPI00215042CC|nr:hypothetical protein [Acinetobacter venetianus]MCR4532491.1 hypothetical protein [Acinetobacter venetianus]
MSDKSNDLLLKQEISAFKQHFMKLWCAGDLAASSDLFDHFIHPQGFVFWNKEQTRQLWDFWRSAQSYKPEEEYPIYSVVGLDQEIDEPHLIIGEDYLMVSEVFHTNDGQAAQEKLEQFKNAFPIAMITNNAIIALECTTIKKERLEKELGLSGRSC